MSLTHKRGDTMNIESGSKLHQWLLSGKYLPVGMRDFHDQKRLFKGMHYVQEGSESLKPSWVDGHCYVIDCFLWYMASRGYTLQKSRVNVEFREFAEAPTPSLSAMLNKEEG